MNEIHFSSNVTLDSFQNQNWNIGDSYNVEFFPGKLVPVFLFDTKSDLTEPINAMSKDQIIFANFEYVSQSIQAPAICLFSFCCSSGVYIFKQTDSNPNLLIKEFMSKQSRKFFVGFKVGEIFQRFKKLFGDNFFLNYDDALRSRIPLRESHDFRRIILKYAGKPSTEYIDFKSRWDSAVLTMKQVLYTAFGVYAFSLSYPNFPKNKPATRLVRKGKLQFTNGSLPNKQDMSFKIGDSYQIELFSGIFTTVCLIDANSDISSYIKTLSKDNVIFADFEYVPSRIDQTNLVPINVFTFCSSAGVYIFQETELNANDQLGEFLKREGQKFYTLGCSPILSKLKKMFGDDFKADIEDVYRTRIGNKKSKKSSINEFIEKFSGKTVKIKKKITKAKKTFWSRRVLSMDQALFVSYVTFGLFLCFNNGFPPVLNNIGEEEDDYEFDEQEGLTENDDDDNDDDKEGQIMDYGHIRFTEETPLSSFKESKWNVGATAEIEFFPDTFSKVYLLDAVTDIEKYIPQISKDGVIFIDFEYVPLSRSNAAPVCLFQFCSSEGAFLFRQQVKKRNDAMKKFLSKEGGHRFVAKGISGDMGRLRAFFGGDFEMNIEDVEQTRLKPYKESLNFENMVERFAGKPSAQFKDKRISCSNWNAKKLTKIQVIYSAFDVVALFACYPHYNPIKVLSYKPPERRKNEQQCDVKKELIEYAISLKKFDQKDSGDSQKVDEFWNLNSYLVPQMFRIDFALLSDAVYKALSLNNNRSIFKCKICRRSSFVYFTLFLKHFKEKHYKKSSKNVDDDDHDAMKKLFFHYLLITGRVYLNSLECFVCNRKFKTIDEIYDHCWNEHYMLLNELTMEKDDETEEEEKGEEESDDDDDDDSSDQ